MAAKLPYKGRNKRAVLFV